MFKKFLTSLLLTLVGVGGFFINVTITKNTLSLDSHVSVSYAQDCFTPDCLAVVKAGNDKLAANTQNAEIQKMLNTLVAAINIILNILTIMVSPAIMLASWLMSPDWTSGDLFGIRPVMHSLWVTVSNITYLIYAILLIFIALATIFNSEHYGYKAMLPKLALGIILVPLTWWAVQFTISLATYVTAAAVSVPAEALKKYTNDSSWWNTYFIPREMIYKNNGDTQGSDGSKLSDKATIDAYCQTTGGGKGDTGKCISPSELTKNAGGLFSPLLIYSYGIFKIQDVQKLTTTTDLVKTILSIINQGIIGALMFLVFGILVLALIFMLMMRAIKLWLYAIFSPLFTIKFVLGEKAFGDADKDGSFNISEFIGLAFVPAVVSLALSFGLIIIAGLMSPSNANNPDNKCEGTRCTITLMGIPANTIVSDVKENISTTTVTIGGVGYTYEGKVEGGNSVVPALSSALSATGNMFGTIIINLIALIFIWIAFMAGKGVSKAAGKAIEPFENMGNQIGKLGMSLPKYVPIPGTGGLSMKSMEKVPGMIDQGISTRADKHFKEHTPLGTYLTKFSGAASAGDVAKAREAVNNYKGREAVEHLAAELRSMHASGKGEQITNDQDMKKVMDTFAEQVKSKDITKDHLDSIKDLRIQQAIIEKGQSGTYNADDKKIVAAWLAGNRNIGLTASGAEDFMKEKKNAKSAEKSAQSGFTKVDIGGATNKDKANINMQGIVVQIDLNTGAGISTNNKEELKKKVQEWTEKEFTTNLKLTGLSDVAIKKIVVDVTEHGGGDFFRKES